MSIDGRNMGRGGGGINTGKPQVHAYCLTNANSLHIPQLRKGGLNV